MPIPDYPFRAMEDCKAAGFDFEAMSKELALQRKNSAENMRILGKLRDTLIKCIDSFENDTPGGARQELAFKWAKTVLRDEFGDFNANS